MKRFLLILSLMTTLQAAPARLKSLTCTAINPKTFTGVCVITLTGKAPNGGMAFRITLPSGGPLAIPMIVTVPKGQTSVKFIVAQVQVLNAA